MPKSKILFMGTPTFACPALKAIAKNHDVCAVYTQPDQPVGRGLRFVFPEVKKLALELGLPVFQPQKLHVPEELERIKQFGLDFIVIVAYGKILKSNLLSIPLKGCINIHASLLPRWRGAAPIQAAIMAGDHQTGVTTMKVAEELDAGDIYCQASTSIEPHDTAQSLHDRLAQMGSELILKTLQGSLISKPQNQSEVTICGKIDKAQQWLTSQRPAVLLERQVRAFNPWPGTSILFEKRLIIKQAALSSLQVPAGQLVVKENRLFFGTIEGSLELLKVQLEGKKECLASDFIHGHYQKIVFQEQVKSFF